MTNYKGEVQIVSSDLSPELHWKVEEQEEEVRHAEAGQEETGVVGGDALPPAVDGQGDSDDGVPDHTNLHSSNGEGL